jgi:cytosine/adenosine deaminase-related metal-dependent hydrolase
VLIEGSKIAAIGPNLGGGGQVTSMIVMPGFINTHHPSAALSTAKSPGYGAQWQDFENGSSLKDRKERFDNTESPQSPKAFWEEHR